MKWSDKYYDDGRGGCRHLYVDADGSHYGADGVQCLNIKLCDRPGSHPHGAHVKANARLTDECALGQHDDCPHADRTEAPRQELCQCRCHL